MPAQSAMLAGAVRPYFKAPALVTGLDDAAVVREPIEHGRRHLGVGE